MMLDNIRKYGRFSNISVALLLLILVSGCGSFGSSDPILLSDIPEDLCAPSSDFSNAIKFHVTADQMDLAAVNTYPQKVSKFTSSTLYDIEICVDHVIYFELNPVLYEQYKYDETVRQYLDSSDQVQVDSEKISQIADTFVAPSASIQTIVGKALLWTKENIKYDEKLADEIYAGTSKGRSAEETLDCKTGTCNEYSNVFIAFMRHLGIPARYIEGFWMTDSNVHMYHAWAEFYLQGYGWIPVDPMTGAWGQAPECVKLFVGKDFADINVELKKINAAYEIIRIEVPLMVIFSAVLLITGSFMYKFRFQAK